MNKWFLIICLLCIGCAQPNRTPSKFKTGNKVRHVVSKQEGIVMKELQWNKYQVRFAVNTIITQQNQVVLQTIDMKDQECEEFELESNEK